jgi:glutathione S-transferase
VLQAINPLFGSLDPSGPKDEAAVAAQLAKLDAALKQLNDLLKPGAYAFGDRLTTADVWLSPVRFMLDGLMNWSGRKDLLDKHPSLVAYADVARGDPHLGRVWREMEEGLRAFLASRKSG